MISVVIPLYNKEAFIAETLESVLSQTYSNFEVIVVDDGSTDSSVAAVQSFTDNRISLFEKRNEGVSVARNYGVDQAQYSWIAFLDADDWWAPTFLEEVVKGIEQFPKEQIFATGRSRVFKGQVERYAHEMLPEEGTTNKMSYFKVISNHLPLVNSSNVVLRKALFLETGGFRPGMRQHEDHERKDGEDKPGEELSGKPQAVDLLRQKGEHEGYGDVRAEADAGHKRQNDGLLSPRQVRRVGSIIIMAMLWRKERTPLVRLHDGLVLVPWMQTLWPGPWPPPQRPPQLAKPFLGTRLEISDPRSELGPMEL